MSIVYVGLDLGSSNFQQVALNHDGVSRVNRDFSTSEANLVKAFSDLKGEIHVHLEAGELAPWAASVIAPLVSRVVCSHPQSNALDCQGRRQVRPHRRLQTGRTAAAESLQGGTLRPGSAAARIQDPGAALR